MTDYFLSGTWLVGQSYSCASPCTNGQEPVTSHSHVTISTASWPTKKRNIIVNKLPYWSKCVKISQNWQTILKIYPNWSKCVKYNCWNSSKRVKTRKLVFCLLLFTKIGKKKSFKKRVSKGQFGQKGSKLVKIWSITVKIGSNWNNKFVN